MISYPKKKHYVKNVSVALYVGLYNVIYVPYMWMYCIEILIIAVVVRTRGLSLQQMILGHFMIPLLIPVNALDSKAIANIK